MIHTLWRDHIPNVFPLLICRRHRPPKLTVSLSFSFSLVFDGSLCFFFFRCQTRLFLYSLLSRNSQNYDNSSSSPRAAYRLHHLRTAVGSAISTRLRLVLDLDANLTTLFSLSSRLRPSLSRIDTSRRDNSISRPRETIKTSRFPANI